MLSSGRATFLIGQLRKRPRETDEVVPSAAIVGVHDGHRGRGAGVLAVVRDGELWRVGFAGLDLPLGIAASF